MPGMTTPTANMVIDALVATAAFVASVAPMKLRQMTANGSNTAAGTELATAGGYTAGTGAPSIGFGAAASQQNANSTAVDITNMPATTIVGVELWDSATTPLRKWYGPLTTSRTLAAGDTLSYAVGAVTTAITSTNP